MAVEEMENEIRNGVSVRSIQLGNNHGGLLHGLLKLFACPAIVTLRGSMLTHIFANLVQNILQRYLLVIFNLILNKFWILKFNTHLSEQMVLDVDNEYFEILTQYIENKKKYTSTCSHIIRGSSSFLEIVLNTSFS